ncbi:MAG: POTRA domain-containing protein, partial [Leptolyngbyaceae cyanobacterium]
MRFSPVLLASMAFSAGVGGVPSAQAVEWVQGGHLISGQPDVVWVMASQPALESEGAIATSSVLGEKWPALDGQSGSQNYDNGTGEGAIAPRKPSVSAPAMMPEAAHDLAHGATQAVAHEDDLSLSNPPLGSDALENDILGHDSLGRESLDRDSLGHDALSNDPLGNDTLNNSTLSNSTLSNSTLSNGALGNDSLENDTSFATSAIMAEENEPSGVVETADAATVVATPLPEEAMGKQAEDSSEPTPSVSPPSAPPPGLTPFTPSPTPSPAEERVLIIEVNVTGVDDRPDLRDTVYRAIQTEPGQTATESQLQNDINAIFATGLFSGVQAGLEDTPLGVRLTVDVTPNPILTGVNLAGSALAASGETLRFGNQDLTMDQVVDAIFSPQYGRTLNRVPPEFAEDTLALGTFQIGINELYEVYSENGYVLAQVVDAQISDEGEVTLVVAEGIIEDIEVQFLDDDGFAEDEEGNPIGGRTRDFIVTREFESQPGDVFNQRNIQRDLQSVFGLGIFDDVRVSLNPGEDPRKVDVIVNVIEGSTGSIAAGAGFSSASGFFGSASYQQQNLGGNNQNLGAEVQVGQRELLFDVRFTDPWIATDPYRTSYTVNSFLRRSISLIFDGGETEVDLCEQRNDLNCNQTDLDDGDRPRVQRLGGGVSFSRPLDEWLGWDGWRASTGFQY